MAMIIKIFENKHDYTEVLRFVAVRVCSYWQFVVVYCYYFYFFVIIVQLVTIYLRKNYCCV